MSQDELDALLAPIALYPDGLLSQVLMASTYPLEVVEADRFVQRNLGLHGEGLDEALAKKNWDPSVQSLAAYPKVLAMMSEKLEWTERLGLPRRPRPGNGYGAVVATACGGQREP